MLALRVIEGGKTFEDEALSEELSREADYHIELPMRGIKQSLNLSVAVGVVGYDFSRCYLEKKSITK